MQYNTEMMPAIRHAEEGPGWAVSCDNNTHQMQEHIANIISVGDFIFKKILSPLCPRDSSRN